MLYFLPKKSILLPTNDKIIGSQDGANIPSSVPTSLQDPAINLYKSVVDFIHFRRLVEWALKPAAHHSSLSLKGYLLQKVGSGLSICVSARIAVRVRLRSMDKYCFASGLGLRSDL